VAHRRARLTPFGRLLLVTRVLEQGWSVSAAAESMGVSDGSNLAFNEAVGWIVGVDGSGLTPLDGRDADWSPTGSRFAFAAGGIWVMNADGSGSHQVAPFGHDPVWSPDGSRIAYINDGSLYVMDLDCTHVGNLGTVEPPRRHTAVVWNPLPPSASGGG
jgi:Tol biopolymer transport system component